MTALSLNLERPPSGLRPGAGSGRLSEADAVDIWLARWLRIRRVDLIRRYGCDPRRLYDIWEERAFPGSREKALQVVEARYPGLASRVDLGPHQRVAKGAGPGQLDLFG